MAAGLQLQLQLQLPESLRDWSDDHRAAFLIARGSNLPGELVFGDSALAQALDARKAAENLVVIREFVEPLIGQSA